MTAPAMHTPGPWDVFGSTGVYAENGREIIYWAHNSRSAELCEQRANARLIAAAPDLLEALRGIVENEHKCTCDGPCDGKCWHAIAIAALAKATNAERGK